MIWRRGFNLWHILLIAVNCLLLVGIFSIWWGEEVVPALVRPGKGPALPKAPLLRDHQPLIAFRVVAAKDLFNQERHGPEETHSAKVEASLEGRELMGTMIIGSDRVALIRDKSNTTKGRLSKSTVDVVRQGDEYDGFKVLEISSETVIFQGKDGKKTLTFPE